MQLVKRSLDKGILQQILDCFVELTGIRASYCDHTIEYVSGKNKDSCSFCRMIQEYPELCKGCNISDQNAFVRAGETGQPYLYRCHMELYEAVIPVLKKNIPAGHLMLGQVKDIEEDEKQWNKISERFHSLNISPEKLSDIKKAFGCVTSMSREKIEAAAKMLQIIAQHVVDTEIIHLYDMEAVEKAKHYINQHFKENFSIYKTAKAVGLSPSYLSFLFKRETGLTMTCYIESLRLAYAKELLTMTSMSVKEICFAVGYEDQNYFSRLFKKNEKLSPIAYRRANKK